MKQVDKPARQVQRPTRTLLSLAVLLAFAGEGWAQQAAGQNGESVVNDANVTSLQAIEVTAEAEEAPPVGTKTGLAQEDIERRGASHMTSLIEQISGTSVNSLYARPEVSVGVQGIAGHGRVAQSLEGIGQNFHAWTRDMGQTGSIFVDPQFLKGIDVSRGSSTGTGALGSLGSSVDFQYLDVDDILLPGKNIGGMLRGSVGLGEYRNGQKPSGSFFLAGRDERWEWMLGAAQSRNDAYRVGRRFNQRRMMRDASAGNTFFFMKNMTNLAI